MLSIFIPVYNEQELVEQSLDKVHAYLEERAWKHEIIVVNNGSTDNTEQVIRQLALTRSWLKVYSIEERGVGKAFALAVQKANGEYLISLDADLSFDLIFIDYAHDLLEYADMVIGSKSMGRQHRSVLRIIASQVYLFFTQILFDLTISDYSIGCKAYRRSSVLPHLENLDPWTGYVLELCFRLNKAKSKLIQVGVDCNDNRSSHFNLFHEGIYRYKHLLKVWRERSRS